MYDLDNTEQLKVLDTMKMGQAIYHLPEQCEQGRKIAEEAEMPETMGPIKSVIIAGLGGSAIGGDLLRSRFEDVLSIPVSVNRDYVLPAYAGKDTLVVASSYSGNTEETLAAYAEAIKRGCKTIAITTGGKLAERALANETPLIRIPGGVQPRAAIGFSFVPLMVVFNRLGLLDISSAGFEEMIDVLKSLREEMKPEVPKDSNPAKRLAERVHGKIPVIYGSQGWKGSVAYRWKCQFNENSKNICYFNTFPELNHNEIVGTEYPGDLLKQTEIVMLRTQDDISQIRRRVDVTSDIMQKREIGVVDVWAKGESPLAQLFSLIYVGDYVTYYLAMLNNVDPSPVEAIAYLKAELAKDS
jgi:glucose/mannose-6-phosphate isomerase